MKTGIRRSAGLPLGWPVRLLIAFALSALAPADAGAAPAAVPGLEVVTAQSPADSSTVKSAQAVCPDGKQVVGLGGSVGGFVPDLITTQIVPNAALTSVTVVGREDENGTPAQWSARAYAICAEPLPGLRLVTRTFPSFDRRPAKGLHAACPSGTKALSAGGLIEGAEGQVLLNTLEVRPATRKLPERAVIAAAEDDTGTDQAWRLHVYGICAEPPAGYQVVWNHTALGSPPSQPLIGPACPTGRRVLGIGGHIGFDEEQVSLRHLIPHASSVSVFALEDHNGAPGDWSMNAQAVCADP